MKNQINAKDDIQKLLSYRVPKLTPEGTCSAGDELDDTPYDLGQILRDNGLAEEGIFELVSTVDVAVASLYVEIKPDWVGVYKKLRTPSGEALVKIAYRGLPSRAEFPLTAEFAEHSNNSTVGLSGKAVLVNSVKDHLKKGQPYYEGDAKVQSELCVPIFSAEKEVIGIIDIESFREHFFNDEKIAKIEAVCSDLSDRL